MLESIGASVIAHRENPITKPQNSEIWANIVKRHRKAAAVSDMKLLRMVQLYAKLCGGYE